MVFENENITSHWEEGVAGQCHQISHGERERA